MTKHHGLCQVEGNLMKFFLVKVMSAFLNSRYTANKEKRKAAILMSIYIYIYLLQRYGIF